MRLKRAFTTIHKWIGLAVGLIVVSAVLLARWRMRARLGLLP